MSSEAITDTLSVLFNSLMIVNVGLIVEVLFGNTTSRDERPSRVHKYILSFVISIILLGLAEVASPTGALSFVLVIFLMIVEVVFCAGTHTPVKKTIIYVLMIIPTVLLDAQIGIVFKLIDRLLGWGNLPFMPEKEAQSPLQLFSEVFLFIALVIVRRFLYARNIRLTLTPIETVVVTLFCFCLPVIEEVMDEIINASLSYTIVLGWVVFLITLNLAFWGVIIHRCLARKYKTEAEAVKQTLNETVDIIRSGEQKREKDIRISHDMKNHFLIINDMLTHGKYVEANDYISKLNESNYVTGITPTGCRIADIIIASKYQQMVDSNISFSCVGKVTIFDIMEDADVCIVFSNLMDNAIEAASRAAEPRFIKMQEVSLGDTFMFTMSNSMSGSLKTANGLLISSKDTGDANTSKRVGIGTQNIRDTINKYGGSCSFRQDGNSFIFELTIKR
ncbi:MAG: sensor histidine kinase [Clostridiales bacterium]|nr:sensor histidine kinase [Clostridiales bacterium]